MNSNIIIGVLVVIIIIGIFYFYNKTQTTQKTADVAVANIAPPCVPFTKAQQDAEKRTKQAKCLNMNWIPLVGQANSIACYRNIDSTLTPIVNC